MTRANHAVAIGLLLLLAGCKTDAGGGGVTPLTPTSISVILSKAILVAVGETTQAAAEVRDQNGNLMAGQAVTWSSSNAPVAEVSGTGLITARGHGTGIISAAAGGANGAVGIQVDQQAVAFEKSGGDGQTGVVARVLPERPTILLTDALGSPVPNRIVQFAVTGGGGSVASTSATGQDGRAGVDWELGTPLGTQRLRATHAQFAVEFTATGVAGAAASITKVSGDAQTGVVLATLALPMVVRLKDNLGHVVAGQDVEFFTTAGSLGSSSGTTDSDGLASTTLTLPSTPGAVIVTASVPGLGLVATFTATAVPGVPAALVKLTGDLQIGAASAVLPVSLTVRVVDASGNPVPSVLVAFAVSSGAVTPASVNSDNQGVAGTVLTLPGNAGTTTVTVSSAGIANVTFTAQSFVQVGLGASLTVGKNHSCARAGSDGAWYCWGSNLNAQLGPGAAFSSTPLLIGGVVLVRVSAGGEHTCGLTVNGEAYCWGLNTSGQLGLGNKVAQALPSRVLNNLRFVEISAGASHTCALDGTGAAYCWGEGEFGQLGNALSADVSVPSPVAGPAFLRISAGQDHTCAVTLGGVAFCWGLNNQGQLGIGTQITRTVPIAVTGGLSFSRVSAGAGYSCGVTQAGAGYCWGEDISGSLGGGGAVPQANPAPVLVLGGLTFTGITAAGGHTCGLAAGLTYCWGLNASGELGIGSMVNQSMPLVLPPGSQHGISLLLPGLGDHTCGLNGLGEVYCWGLNTSGQVGIAAGAPVTAPVMVPGWPR